MIINTFSGHALGFFHEQSRPDRDNFVEILLKNVLPGKYANSILSFCHLSPNTGVPTFCK